MPSLPRDQEYSDLPAGGGHMIRKAIKHIASCITCRLFGHKWCDLADLTICVRCASCREEVRRDS